MAYEWGVKRELAAHGEAGNRKLQRRYTWLLRYFSANGYNWWVIGATLSDVSKNRCFPTPRSTDSQGRDRS